MAQKINPALLAAVRIAKGIFLLTTVGVTIFFIREFWPVISQIPPQAVIWGGGFVLSGALFAGLMITTGALRPVTLVKFVGIIGFFLTLAVVYSYVGAKIGITVRQTVSSVDITGAPLR